MSERTYQVIIGVLVLVILVAGDSRGEGLDLCRRLAQRGSPPILMLSGTPYRIAIA